MDWSPLDGIELETAAYETVIGNRNCYVMAGPGAGKTELLAQRASYLLQTGTCHKPRRILALTYKKDATKNIADRVGKRVGRELSTRFVSMTYDGFAKTIFNQFLFVLP